MEQRTFKDRLLENFDVYAEHIVLSDELHPNGITYRELQKLSGRVYAWLKKNGIGREQRVMIHLPRGLEACVVCVGVWRAGAAFTITEEGYPRERVDQITKDCECVLTIDRTLYDRMMEEEPLQGWEETDPHDAAYIVYTSGTTGVPKGALHEVGQLTLTIESAMYQGTDFCRPDDRCLLLSPLSFVASVIVLVGVLAGGGQLNIVSYNTVRNPVLLMKYMNQEKITAAFITPSLVKIFVEAEKREDHRHPFNPEMRKLFLSSEPAANIWFCDLTVFNVFAQSELGFLGGVFQVDRPYDITPIGKSMVPDIVLSLMDVSDGKGEICVSNPYFRGYLNHPEMTVSVLRDGIYHTGDIGTMTEEGDLILLGRSDDMVKINGNRVEPAEIEAAAKKVLGVSWCAARAFVKPERSYICVYYTEEPGIEEAQAIAQLSEMLPSYMIPSCFMKIDKIPLSANGKMLRRALPEPSLEENTEYTAPADETEKMVCRAFASVLKKNRISVLDDFYQCGGDSIKTIQLMGEMDQEGLTAQDVFRERTARNLAALIRKKGFCTPEELMRREEAARQEAFPLTDFQKNIYQIQMRDPASFMWVLPLIYSFDLSREEQLKNALITVMNNHPVFSTILEEREDGGVFQRYAPECMQKIGVEEKTEEEILHLSTYLDDPDLPFQMIGNPLVRVRLYRTEKQLYMFFAIHHIVIDGIGLQVLIGNIGKAMGGEKISPDGYYSWLKQYHQIKASDAWTEAKDVLDKMYDNVPWTGEIPPETDMIRGTNSVLGVFLPLKEQDLKETEKRTDLSRTGLFAAVMLLALGRYTRQRDIMLNWVYANRDTAEKNRIAGLLIRSLVLGVHMDPDASMGSLFSEIREQMQTNIAHSVYEWGLHNPPENGADRLFFIFEGDMTGYDILKDVDGTLLPLLAANQSVVHHMSTQILSWKENELSGMMIACYYISSLYGEENMQRFRSILQETAERIWSDPEICTRSIGEFFYYV